MEERMIIKRKKVCPCCGRLLWKRKDFYQFKTGKHKGEPMTYCKECTHKKDAARYQPRKPAVKLCKDGRIRNVKGKGCAPIHWSTQMLDDLKRMFHNHSNEDCAARVGVSVRTMIRKARELGLVKDPSWLHIVWDENRMIAHFVSRSKGYPGAFKKGEHHCPEHEFKKKTI